MRALVLYEHGGLDKLVYEPNYRNPEPGPGEILLRTRACALNYHDVFTRRGMPGITLSLPLIPGNDAAGEVAALGEGVSGFEIGDRVLVDPSDHVNGRFLGETLDGGLGEYVRLPEHMLIRLDNSVSFAEAAALPVAYGTAHRMMFARGQVKAGETVLILGASGGVGTCCVQLAKQAGATVVGLRLERGEARAAQGLRRRYRHQLSRRATGWPNATVSSAAPAPEGAPAAASTWW